LASGPTRRDLLATGALAGVVGVAGASLLEPATALAERPGLRSPPATEVQRLQRLIGLEQLLLYCYESVLASPVSGPRMHRALTPLSIQEQAHIRALERVLLARGGSAPEPPADAGTANRRLAKRGVGGRLGQLRGAHDALRLLLSLERVTVGAYFVALTTLEDPQLILLVTQIMANDAQHEALLGLQLYYGNAEQSVPYGLVQGVQ
jgi:hypothetical protein